MARWTLGHIAQSLKGELRGPADHPVERPVPADADDPEGIAFAESARYLAAAEASGVGALLVPPGLETAKPAVVVPRPREAFGWLLAQSVRPIPLDPGVHPLACIHPEAEVDPTARIGPYAVVERGAKIGPHVAVYPFAYVGDGCVLEDSAVVLPHAVLVQDVRVGARTIIHPGAVLGADGFGFAWDGQRHRRIPQVGGVEIGADAEIGALAAVDRATCGETKVGDGTKIDNFVQVAHNVRIGKHSVFAAFVGLSGSTRVGDRVTMAGQVATSQHVAIGNDITLGGRSGVTKDLLEPGAYVGLPAQKYTEGMRSMALATKLPELFERVKELERKLAESQNKP